MVMCWAPECKHYNIRETCKFFKFPKDSKERLRWKKLVRRRDEPGPGAFLCSCHFPDGKRENGPQIFEYNKMKRFTFSSPERKRKRTAKSDVGFLEMQWVHKSIDTKSRKMCSVPQCSSYRTNDVSLHAFPSDPKLCKIWRRILKIDKPVTKYMLVCSLHFTETDFSRTTNKRHRLKNRAVPSRKIPKTTHSTKTVAIDRSQRHRLQKCTSNQPEENEKSEKQHLEESGDTIIKFQVFTDDSTKKQEVVPSQEFSNYDSCGLQSVKEILEKRPDAIEVTILQEEAFASGDVTSDSEETLDGFESTTVPDQDVESEHVEIVSDNSFSEFGDELKCRTCMQITYGGLPLDAPCFTTRSIKDAIIQLLPELVPYLKDEDVICPNCVIKFNVILKFLDNCLRVNNSLACLADKKDLDKLGKQNNEKPLVLEDDDSFDYMSEDGGKSTDIEKQNEVVAKKGIKPGPKRCFVYSTFLTVPNNNNIVSFNGIESDKSLELARTFTDLGIRVADESKRNGKKRIVLIGNTNIWMCPICRMAFRLESELHRHAIDVHKLLKAHLLTPKTYFNENSGNSDKVFICPYCDESVPMNSLVEHTVKKHGDPKPFKCFDCRKVFGSYKWYKRHSNILYRHPSYNTVCKICDKRIKWESYKEHFDNHKTFQCEFCDKCFTNKTSLRTHEVTHKAIHNGESTLCPSCGKTFSIQGLNMHVKRVHEEQTKGDLLCHVCSKTLCTQKALARHIDSVHNAKQVDCKLCGKIFSSNISLQSHLRCNVCSVKFGCPFCKREFIRKNRLKMHMIKNHNSANISESKIIRRRIRSDDVGEVENTENEPNIINDLDANVGMNMENES